MRRGGGLGVEPDCLLYPLNAELLGCVVDTLAGGSASVHVDALSGAVRLVARRRIARGEEISVASGAHDHATIMLQKIAGGGLIPISLF